MLRLSTLGFRRDPHGSVKQIQPEELEDGDKERPRAFPKIMLKQTDSGIQHLHGAGIGNLTLLSFLPYNPFLISLRRLRMR